MKKLTVSFLALMLLLSNSLTAQWVDLDSGYDSPWILFDNSFPAGQNDVGFFAGMYTTYDGDGVILKTEDAGANFTTVLGGSDGSLFGIEAIYFTSLDNGFAAGWDDDIKYTDDGGDSWSDMTVGSGIWYYTDIEFWDADNGVISAKMNSGSDKVWVTDDGGDSWTEATGISIGIIDMGYADATTLYAVGSEEDILKSTDGGSTWSINYNGSDPDNDPLLGVHFYDSNFGIVGGMDGKVLVTTNGGGSWTVNEIAGNYPSFYAVYCFNADSAYVGGTDKIIYKTTDGGSSWSSVHGGGGSSLYQFAFTDNKTGFVSGSSGAILWQEAPLNANFEADQTEVCTGTTVNFTDLSGGAISWSWTFEGGTPSTSTDQNPSVTYNTPGTYNVELEVSDGVSYITEIKFDYITVLETPAQADVPAGETGVCTGGFYTYTIDEVDYAEVYEWELSPADAGSIEGNGTTASYTADDTWTGDFTIRVRATNMCGDGAWSNNLEATLSLSPAEFTLEGGGGFCFDGDGVELALDGSQTGVDYELYLDGSATGNIVAGTGSEISFGMVTVEGYYTCVGSNDDCSNNMIEEIHVYLMFAPLEPATPTGPEVVCEETSSDYETTGSEEADTYTWELSPEEAGTITGNGLIATIEWDAGFIGMAYVSVYGSNDCGDGNVSEALEVGVGAPLPKISGAEMVCDLQVETYEVDSHDGSTYTWEVTGGSITEGQGTNLVTITWGEAGMGMISLEEETAGGCTGIAEDFEVTIDDCTGIEEALDASQINLYPNPTSDMLNVRFSSAKTNITVSVCNHLGQKIISKDVNSGNSDKTVQFNISDLSAGMYFVKIESNDGLLKHKQFIKK